MTNRYILYLTNLNECDTVFSPSYCSLNTAKENMDAFLAKHAEKRGKRIEYISKEQFEVLKVSKKLDDFLYIKKKGNEATLYHRQTYVGRIYNTFSLEKYGKLAITEIALSNDSNESVESIKLPQEQKKNIKDVAISQHGRHVSFIAELKTVIANKKNKVMKPVVVNKQKVEPVDFVLNLLQGKVNLRHITPPPPRKLIL